MRQWWERARLVVVEVVGVVAVVGWLVAWRHSAPSSWDQEALLRDGN